MQKTYTQKILTITICTILLILILPKLTINETDLVNSKFNAERAFKDLEYQVSLGSRIPGTEAHAKTVDWLLQTMMEAGWETNLILSNSLGHPIINIQSKRGSGSPWIILGTHYDSRIKADKDYNQENRDLPVPGANDGASGVALLIEIARVLPKDLPFELWLVFFDAEDNGNIEGWDWILGSRSFVNELEGFPDKMILVDMIGDRDLNIFMERNSDPTVMSEIWGIASELGYSKFFIPIYKHALVDDHIPFVEAGVPSVNIIDYDYPYWHTTADTLDKVSAESLSIVGDTLLVWLESIH